MNLKEKNKQTKNKERERAEVHQGPQRVLFQGRDN